MRQVEFPPKILKERRGGAADYPYATI